MRGVFLLLDCPFVSPAFVFSIPYACRPPQAKFTFGLCLLAGRATRVRICPGENSGLLVQLHGKIYCSRPSHLPTGRVSSGTTLIFSSSFEELQRTGRQHQHGPNPPTSGAEAAALEPSDICMYAAKPHAISRGPRPAAGWQLREAP